MSLVTWHLKTFEELSKEELYQLIQLRIEVFIIEQNAPYQDCDEKDYKAHHLFATQEAKVVACCRLLPAGISYAEPSIGRVVTSSSTRGTAMGKKMMYLAMEIMKTIYNTTDCRISAQSYLQKFYGEYGFRKVSEEYLEDGLPHMEMLK